MTSQPPELPLHLDPISGPETAPISVRSASNILGRGGKSSIVLGHDGVSREHLSITCHGRTWYVTDLGSRNGTRLGNLPLPPGVPTPVQEGDTLEIKPWVFLLRIGHSTTRSAARTIDDAAASSTRIRTSETSRTEPRLRQQFESLLRASALLHSAKDEGELLDHLLQTALGATGFERAAVIRKTESVDSVELVAQRFRADKTGTRGQFHFSRSLLRAAAHGPHAAVADPGALTPRPDTMVKHDIAAAACAPIRLNEALWGFLYLDSGAGTPPTATGELLDLVRSLVDIASLALSSVKQHEVRKRLASLQADFEAAAEIQRFLLPAPSGVVNGLTYAVQSVPGRIVSGDIFDVVDLGGRRVAVFLGDVMGKGLAAGLLMCSVWSHMQALLRQSQDPGEILELMNRFVLGRVGGGRIVSLWLGIIDTERRVLTASDAGHGYCLTVKPGAAPERLVCAGGTPLGAAPEASYLSSTAVITPGQRIVIFSDGIVEQPSPRGDPFGLDRLNALLRSTDEPSDIVERIFAGVRDHAGSNAASDDETAAAVALT